MSRYSRRHQAAVLAAAFALALCGAARAELQVFQATLSLEGLAPEPAPAATAIGVATLNSSGGGAHVATLQFPGGLLSVHTTVPVTTAGSAPPLTAVRLDFTVGGGTLTIGSGGTLSGALPVPGNLRLCLLLDCALFFDAPLTAGGTRGVGLGGPPIMAPIGALGTLTLGGGPWGTGPAAVATSGGSVVRTGFAHGPLSATSTTASPQGALQLVTPIAVSFSSAPGVTIPIFGVLEVKLLPEPEAGALLGSGVALLLWLGARRARA